MSDISARITAIIAEDEIPSRTLLKKQLLSVWPDLDIIGEAENGVEAKEMIEELNPDCAFLDIKMPGLSGMEVARRTAGMCRIVFITAYDQYAVDAFDNEAVDYILKPATEERLGRTVQRLKAQIESKSPIGDISETIEKLMTKISTQKSVKQFLQWVRAQVGDSISLVPVDKIYFFQAKDKYTTVMTKNEEYLIRKTITELTEELNPDLFFQIHRSTIVNAGFIDKIYVLPGSRGQLRLKDRPEIHHISRSYSNWFKLIKYRPSDMKIIEPL
jgi:DNA-binding LytR/AlgR family response regulator